MRQVCMLCFVRHVFWTTTRAICVIVSELIINCVEYGLQHLSSTITSVYSPLHPTSDGYKDKIDSFRSWMSLYSSLCTKKSWNSSRIFYCFDILWHFMTFVILVMTYEILGCNPMQKIIPYAKTESDRVVYPTGHLQLASDVFNPWIFPINFYSKQVVQNWVLC